MSGTPSLSQSDLEQLNALADGELSASEAAHWRSRIESDQQAAKAFAEIIEVKAKLKTLRSDLHPAHTSPKESSKKAGLPLRAIAASIAAAFLIGGVWIAIQSANTAPPVSLLDGTSSYPRRNLS